MEIFDATIALGDILGYIGRCYWLYLMLHLQGPSGCGISEESLRCEDESDKLLTCKDVTVFVCKLAYLLMTLGSTPEYNRCHLKDDQYCFETMEVRWSNEQLVTGISGGEDD